MQKYTYKNQYIIQVIGKDAISLINGLVTANISLLNSVNKSVYTAFLNHKGRIISLSFIQYIADNNFMISVNSDIANKLIAWIKKYAMFSKVEINLTEDYQLVFKDFKDYFLNHQITKKNDSIDSITIEEITKQNVLAKISWSNKYNFEKLITADIELDSITNAVAYDKGCYMGQEIVSRMKYIAKSKKELVAISINSKYFFEKNKLISIDNKQIGEVVNSVCIENKTYALVILNAQISTSEIIFKDNISVTRC